MTPREFENYVAMVLREHGYWAHRIAPDESGQQPFDIIAMKEDVACAYDAKVLSRGYRFPMDRIEDNQLNAFELFHKKVWYTDVGCLIYHDGGIRYFSLDDIETAIRDGVKSIDVRSLPVWKVI